MRNWEGVVENNFISMKDSVCIGNNAAVNAIFYMPGEASGSKDWPAKTDITIRGNYLEGRVSTSIMPKWTENYKVHILNNTIVPVEAGKSLVNITAAGSATIDGVTKYYSNIDTADILISDNKIKNLYNVTGIGFSYFSGTVTADADTQISEIQNYKAGNIKITHNDIDFGTVSGSAFGGTAVKGYDNLVFDITCNKYGETVTPVKDGLECNFAALSTTDETAHKDVKLVTDTQPTTTANGVGHTECAFCGELIAENVEIPATGEALIGDTYYGTVEEAFAAAKAGQIITLNKDASVGFISVDSSITLDLNGNALTADYVVGFKGSVICDGSEDNSGKLIAPKDKVVLDKNNGGYLPVYNKMDEENGYYTFSTVKLENRAAMLDDNVYGFSPIFNSTVHAALAEGKANSGVKIVVRLSWEKAGNYEAYQDYIYLDEMVEKVMNGYNTTKPNNYADMFVAEFTGTEIEGAEDVTVRAMILSETGVELASSVSQLQA